MKISKTLSRRAFLAGAVTGTAGAVGAFSSGQVDLPIGSGALVALGGATDAEDGAPFVFPSGRWTESAHLLRRAGFGGSRADIVALAGLSRDEAVDRVMEFGVADDADRVLSELGIDLWNRPGRWAAGGLCGWCIAAVRCWSA